MMYLALLILAQSPTINSTYKQRVFDAPLTSAYTQSTTVLTDKSVDSYHLTAIAGPTIDATGMTVNGSTQYATRSIANFRGSDSIGSISIWFKGTSINSTLFSSSDTATGNYYLWLRLEGAGKLSIIRKNATFDGAVAAGTASLADDAWHHAVVTSNGSAWKLYVDGVSETVTNDIGTNTGAWFDDLNSAADNLSVGMLVATSAGSGFTGTLSYPVIWDRALTLGEITYLYGRGRKVDVTILDAAVDVTILSP